MISLFWFTTFTMFLRFYDLSELHRWNNNKRWQKSTIRFVCFRAEDNCSTKAPSPNLRYDYCRHQTYPHRMQKNRHQQMFPHHRHQSCQHCHQAAWCELWVRGVTSTDWITTLAAQSLFSFNPTLSVEGKSWLSFIQPRVRIPILMLPVCWSAKAMARRIVVSRCILLGGSWLP